jgi:hypothetical protein
LKVIAVCYWMKSSQQHQILSLLYRDVSNAWRLRQQELAVLQDLLNLARTAGPCAGSAAWIL